MQVLTAVLAPAQALSITALPGDTRGLKWHQVKWKCSDFDDDSRGTLPSHSMRQQNEALCTPTLLNSSVNVQVWCPASNSKWRGSVGLLEFSWGSQKCSPAQLLHPNCTLFSYSGFPPTVQIKVCLEADACLKSAQQQQQHELLQLSPNLHGKNEHQARSWVSLLKGIPKIQKFLCLHTLKQHTWEIWTKLDWLYGVGFTTNPWVPFMLSCSSHLILRVQLRVFHNNFTPFCARGCTSVMGKVTHM